MPLLEPDDFQDRPYVGGLNQMGHFGVGAAAAAAAVLLGASVFWSILIVGLFFIAWEAYQLKRRNASLKDYAYDLAYWLCGAGCWQVLLYHDSHELFPIALPVIWTIEYTRLSFAEYDR